MIAKIPLTMDVLTSPSINSNSLSFFSKFPSRFLSEEATYPPKSLSLKDIIDCWSESTTILLISPLITSLNLTFLVFQSPPVQDFLSVPLAEFFVSISNVSL
ncbi:hypothetical protein ES332_A01G153300v1 [Gossypium tomentosum]|uniref:Uncharacterized protein n=1 Tax=Gossypium tomentosum TaxID=34277 RepID=A0A5D2RTV8_GOSTO|nr:hypothetical protein ES332_A01G153300v1 [Gossypium tomentosum]